MGGRDEIDVMAPNLLKVKHPVCQVFISDFLPLALVRNGPVLAEDTPKIAVGEEDRAGSFLTYQRHFFAKMGMGAENHGFDRSPTESLYSFLPIHTTLPWTELTIFEDRIGLFNPLKQSTFPLQFLIGRKPLTLFLGSSIKGNGRKEQRAPQE
jgi:hypothetical protein